SPKKVDFPFLTPGMGFLSVDAQRAIVVPPVFCEEIREKAGRRAVSMAATPPEFASRFEPVTRRCQAAVRPCPALPRCRLAADHPADCCAADEFTREVTGCAICGMN